MKEFLHNLRCLSKDLEIPLKYFSEMARYYGFYMSQLENMLENNPETFSLFYDDYQKVCSE